MRQDIAHAAYEVAKKAHGAGHADAKERLQRQFPDLPWDELVEIYLSACQLHESAYDVASKVRDRVLSEQQAPQELRARCPGFGDETYKRAMADGFYESLW